VSSGQVHFSSPTTYPLLAKLIPWGREALADALPLLAWKV
jgi:hypothetical protein